MGLVADTAIARTEFEDGLRTGVLPGGYWCLCGGDTKDGFQIFLGVRVGYWGNASLSDQTSTCLVPHMSGVENTAAMWC